MVSVMSTGCPPVGDNDEAARRFHPSDKKSEEDEMDSRCLAAASSVDCAQPILPSVHEEGVDKEGRCRD